jgi:hypothetical protein
MTVCRQYICRTTLENHQTRRSVLTRIWFSNRCHHISSKIYAFLQFETTTSISRISNTAWGIQGIYTHKKILA